MASVLGWYDTEGKEIMEQDLVAATIPLDHGEHLLEIQITMCPAAGQEKVVLDQTNFGFLAVRVAKTPMKSGVTGKNQPRKNEQARRGGVIPCPLSAIRCFPQVRDRS